MQCENLTSRLLVVNENDACHGILLIKITLMAYYMDMEFIETPVFTKIITELLSDCEYSAFQKYLIDNPESGDVIKGGSGIRKIRWSLAGRGKSGSIRGIYYYKIVNKQIFLIYAYTKKKKSDLSEQEKKLFGEIAKEFAK